MVNKQDLQVLARKFVYGSLFVVIIPLLLFSWSFELDKSISWPIPNWPLISIYSILFGGFLVSKGMLDLLTIGHGLPMNAFPPKKLVTQGVYAWFSHPIYFGTALLSIGIASWFHSSSGLYIITPVLILMMMSLVYGYERFAIRKLFGDSVNKYQPLFSIPSSDNKRATRFKKMAMLTRIFLPWFIIGYLTNYARCSISCTEDFISLTNLLWLLPYIYIAFKILSSKTEIDLRHMAIVGSLATLGWIYLYVLLPAFGLNLDNSELRLLLINLGIVILSFNYRLLWSLLQRFSEWVANSRHDWIFINGNLRIINHSVYSSLSGAVGVAIASLIMGNNIAVLALTLSTLIGGAVFAQIWWGSNALLRPFGYWGAILGGIVGVFLVYFFFNIPLSKIFLAGVLCAPFVQAIGRLRCLAQGCCHGTITNKTMGIRVRQNQSRVVVLSGLKGKYILNTQLYSILFNLMLGLLLWALWLSQTFSSSFVIGTYLILTGIERFTEDAYRGEKQTRMLWRLRENQWIAIGALIIGILVTIIPSSIVVKSIGAFDLQFLITVLIGGLFAAFFMSIDFPKSCLRFSRLSG